MRINFYVREPGNFLHILDSISEWDIHTRRNIKRYYEKKFGVSKEDKKFIKMFIKIRKKYSWAKLDCDFYLSENLKEALKKCKKRLNNAEFSEFKAIINHFYKKNHALFLDFVKDLIRRKKLLEIEVKKHNIQRMLKDIANFYNINRLPKQINIHMIVNASGSQSGGGANIEEHLNENISLEPRMLNKNLKKDLFRDIGIIVHESLHLIEHLEKKNNIKEILKKEGLIKDDSDILREAIADTLVPFGYFAVKYGLVKSPWVIKSKNLKITPKNKSERYYCRDFRAKLAACLYPLTVKQIEEGKSLWQGNYLKEAIKMFKQMKRR